MNARRLLARLGGWVNAGQVLLPDVPHRYAPEWPWPLDCWCTAPKSAAVHMSRGAAL